MALNDAALFTAAKGFVYIHDPDTAVKPTPSQISAHTEETGLGAGWIDLGHTSRDDLPEFGFEGGDTETRGTWRAAAVREVITEQAVDFVVIRLQQLDDANLELYYGVPNNSSTEGEFEVLDSASSTIERALCIVMEDGDARIAFYAPKASIRRDDSITLGVDEFAVLPVRATFLKPQGGAMFAWINEDLLNLQSS